MKIFSLEQWIALCLSAICFYSVNALSDSINVENTVIIPAGEFRPLFAKPKEPSEKIKSFRMDALPVTQLDFFNFVKTHPEWQRESASHLFFDSQYLKHWQADDQRLASPIEKTFLQPVVFVSWFAARAYCQSKHKRLPTTAEWEYVAKASENLLDARKDKLFSEKILSWYGKPQTLENMPDVNQSAANLYGVKDLHNLVWEWTSDFNSVLSTGESRGDSTTDNQFFCGSGAAGSADPSDYASFMRYAMRTSLQASYSLGNLGFRCAADVESNSE